MDAPLKSLRPSAGQLALAEQLAAGRQALGSAIERLPATLDTGPDRFGA